MRFPNAHNGVKKIFTAEILSLSGNQVRMYLMIAYCVPILMHLISTILSMNTDSVLSEGLDLFASVLSLVVYVIYLGYLSKARKMLEK